MIALVAQFHDNGEKQEIAKVVQTLDLETLGVIAMAIARDCRDGGRQATVRAIDEPSEVVLITALWDFWQTAHGAITKYASA